MRSSAMFPRFDGSSAALSAVRLNTSRAYAMLRELYTGWTTVRVLEQLATELPQMSRDKQFLFVPVAVGVAAERLTRSDLARVAADALRPWSGQAIGMWPVDLILGMADSWIERFEAV